MRVDNSDEFKLSVGLVLSENTVTEFTYIRQTTDLLIKDAELSPMESKLSDLAIDWLQLGGKVYFSETQIKPFFGAGGGVAIFSPKNNNNNITEVTLDNRTAISFFMKGGVEFELTEWFALNLQGNLYFPTRWGRIYSKIGTDGPESIKGIKFISTMAGFSGGFIFKIN